MRTTTNTKIQLYRQDPALYNQKLLERFRTGRTNKRNYDITMSYLSSSKTLDILGREFGIARERIRQIVMRELYHVLPRKELFKSYETRNKIPKLDIAEDKEKLWVTPKEKVMKIWELVKEGRNRKLIASEVNLKINTVYWLITQLKKRTALLPDISDRYSYEWKQILRIIRDGKTPETPEITVEVTDISTDRFAKLDKAFDDLKLALKELLTEQPQPQPIQRSTDLPLINDNGTLGYFLGDIAKLFPEPRYTKFIKWHVNKTGGMKDGKYYVLKENYDRFLTEEPHML